MSTSADLRLAGQPGPQPEPASVAPMVTVVVPTLGAGGALADCLRSLESQTLQSFEIVVVDNGGTRQVKDGPRVRVIANARNLGFGAAINQGYASSQAPFLVTLNDDAVADPRWLETLVACAQANPQAGMFASEVRLAGRQTLDSAGMLIAPDGSGKQRGHGQPPEALARQTESLFPSGSAALYRRKMLEQTGLFDETYFLYCEDVDLGLRARWAGWQCRYVPGAVVEHKYSHSAGRASPLKAYYVERNRLCTILKNFPLKMLLRAPLAAAGRYFWHALLLLKGEGKAAEFGQQGHWLALLPFLVLRAHVSALFRLPRLLAERRRIQATRRIPQAEFESLLARHSISIRQVAAL